MKKVNFLLLSILSLSFSSQLLAEKATTSEQLVKTNAEQACLQVGVDVLKDVDGILERSSGDSEVLMGEIKNSETWLKLNKESKIEVAEAIIRANKDKNENRKKLKGAIATTFLKNCKEK